MDIEDPGDDHPRKRVTQLEYFKYHLHHPKANRTTYLWLKNSFRSMLWTHGLQQSRDASTSSDNQSQIQHCQDALAINRHFRGADLFLTMAANPNWPEIKEALLPGQISADRPDLVDCVFHSKVQALKDDLFTNGYLGRTVACVWIIEFQKHGLPQIHMIIFLHPNDKLWTLEDIDSLLSAEFLDKDEEPELFELVKKLMVHTPCGAHNPNAPCMCNRKCSKGFLKPFRDQTTVNEDSYANLRR